MIIIKTKTIETKTIERRRLTIDYRLLTEHATVPGDEYCTRYSTIVGEKTNNDSLQAVTCILYMHFFVELPTL